jgi:hypothetical protein
LGCVFLALTALSGRAQSEVYKCPGANGQPTYTNVKSATVGKNCTVVSKEIQVVPSQAPASSSSSRNSAANADRAENRRKILESELQNEQQLLTDAQQKLTEQEGIRSGDERNYARVQERLKPFQEAVDLHTKNIEQLRGELGRLR